MHHLIAILVLIFTPSIAKAEINEAKINTFNQAYTDVYQTCNMAAIRQFVADHFSDDYASVFQNPQTGQSDRMTKAETLDQMQASIDYINQNNLSVTGCNTDVSVQNTIIQNGQAIVALKQTENMTLRAPNGQTVPVTLKTFCNHVMQDNGGKVVVTQSQCMVQQ